MPTQSLYVIKPSRHENDCVGRSKLRSNWNGYALIEDIAVAKDYRKNGVGTALLHKAIEWAKENHLCGLMLEVLNTLRHTPANDETSNTVIFKIYSTKKPQFHLLLKDWNKALYRPLL